jgi:hypothetical protein
MSIDSTANRKPLKQRVDFSGSAPIFDTEGAMSVD